ncbi:zf-U1-domain-containing protein, partial [Schizopora paradoxa]
KHYCDYCDVYLTHDSQAVRRAHNNGRNHIQNVKEWFSAFTHKGAQDYIDAITQQYEGGGPPAGYRPPPFNFPAPPPQGAL